MHIHLVLRDRGRSQQAFKNRQLLKADHCLKRQLFRSFRTFYPERHSMFPFSSAADLQSLFRSAEQRFGLDPGLCRIAIPSGHRYFDAHVSCLAYVDDMTIMVRPDLGARSPNKLAHILLHELAHVAQKQKGKCKRSWSALCDRRDQYEWEADAAAVAVMCGSDLTISPDPTDTWPHFEEDGHYYTTYYAAAAAGMPSHLAAKIAFMSQLPDLVGELDATTVLLLAGMAGEVTVGDLRGVVDTQILSRAIRVANVTLPRGVAPTLVGIARWLGPNVSIPSGVTPSLFDIARQFGLNMKSNEEYSRLYMKSIVRQPNYSASAQQLINDPRRLCACVQIGLHSLTGNAALTEQRTRYKALRAYHPETNPLELGLAIHAYGDSYAHVDLSAAPAKMYNFPCGHMKDQHKPDEIPTRPRLYAKFANSLRQYFSDLWYADKDKQMSSEEFVQSLIGFVFDSDKARRIEKLRALIAERYGNGFGTVDLYRPEEIDVDLWLLAKRTAKKGYGLSLADLDTAFSCARLWSYDIPSIGSSNPDLGSAIPDVDFLPKLPLFLPPSPSQRYSAGPQWLSNPHPPDFRKAGS